MTDTNWEPRIIGSGEPATHAIRIGNTTRGYKRFIAVGDNESIKPTQERIVDDQSLTGKMWRHAFKAEPQTWEWSVLIEDYTVSGLSEYSNQRAWLMSIAATGMIEAFNLWDTGALGNYTAHTAVNGITYPIEVVWLPFGALDIRNHDTFLRDTKISVRKRQVY